MVARICEFDAGRAGAAGRSRIPLALSKLHRAP